MENAKTIYIDDSSNFNCIPFDVDEITEQSNHEDIIWTQIWRGTTLAEGFSVISDWDVMRHCSQPSRLPLASTLQHQRCQCIVANEGWFVEPNFWRHWKGVDKIILCHNLHWKPGMHTVCIFEFEQMQQLINSRNLFVLWQNNTNNRILLQWTTNHSQPGFVTPNASKNVTKQSLKVEEEEEDKILTKFHLQSSSLESIPDSLTKETNQRNVHWRKWINHPPKDRL
jgi:hypothetical protein